MVIPRSFSSFALSIWSKGVKGFPSGYLSCSTLVIAAVSVVLPWSMCPMVPMFRCGLLRTNLALATGISSLRSPTGGGAQVSLSLQGAFAADGWTATRLGWSFAPGLRDDLLGDARWHLGVRVELHRVVRPALGPA